MSSIVIGYDIGTSSIKASLLDIQSGALLGSAVSPQEELYISSPHSDWAEQDPGSWWKHMKLATRRLRQSSRVALHDVAAVGLSYQEHGLVLVDHRGAVVRPAIIWCDSRAVETGERALRELGDGRCFTHLLNSPGNFTASKLRWVIENEPESFAAAAAALLPGDYAAYRMTGELLTTPEGLSEWILWDYESDSLARFLLEHYKIPLELLPPLTPSFGTQGLITREAAEELGLRAGTPLTYRGGDQHSNAVGLGVLEAGEAAVSAGTSGVVFAVTSERRFDRRSRVNSFLHVNHRREAPRLAVVMCINGAAIAYRWLRDQLHSGCRLSYEAMNRLAAQSPIGSNGVRAFPFGNGAERTLGNRNIACWLGGIAFNSHGRADVARAIQEGIAFAFRYGVEVLSEIGVAPRTFRGGFSGMFLSTVFAEAMAANLGAPIELFDSDASRGAAWGAAVGAGLVPPARAGARTRSIRTVEVNKETSCRYQEVYAGWRELLSGRLLDAEG